MLLGTWSLLYVGLAMVLNHVVVEEDLSQQQCGWFVLVVVAVVVVVVEYLTQIPATAVMVEVERPLRMDDS
jgi:hypothetical protein